MLLKTVPEFYFFGLEHFGNKYSLSYDASPFEVDAVISHKAVMVARNQFYMQPGHSIKVKETSYLDEEDLSFILDIKKLNQYRNLIVAI